MRGISRLVLVKPYEIGRAPAARVVFRFGRPEVLRFRATSNLPSPWPRFGAPFVDLDHRRPRCREFLASVGPRRKERRYLRCSSDRLGEEGEPRGLVLWDVGLGEGMRILALLVLSAVIMLAILALAAWLISSFAETGELPAWDWRA
jgi:hypothetical protein